MSVFYLILVCLLGAVVVGSIGYLLLLLAAAALSRFSANRRARKISAESLTLDALRFAVLVPAHNEELVLAGTLESLSAQNYAASRMEVVVIADNCDDATAKIARAHGATVLERFNDVERGKGYALDWAMSQLLSRPTPADAFVIVDADTWVDPDFLRSMATRLTADQDARGFCALQGRYGVLNSAEGWRAALMAGAFDLYNHVKPQGRDQLGFGVGLKGNGMAFTRPLLEQARWRGDSVTEDIDYGLDLARHHNVRVGYAPEARVLAQMPTTAGQAASQRERWEHGRFQLVRTRALPMLVEALRRRNLLLCDAALDLLLLPMAELMGLVLLWGGLILFGIKLDWLSPWWFAAFAGSVAGIALYVLGGFRIAGASRDAYAALLRAPLYAFWKFALLLRPRKKKASPSPEWIRTSRAPLSPVTNPSEARAE